MNLLPETVSSLGVFGFSDQAILDLTARIGHSASHHFPTRQEHETHD
jgi:hypothetical protein